MNRRAAIRNVVLVTVGTALLPSCLQEKGSTIKLKHLALTESQEQTLAALAAAIIPSSKNFVGAAELKSHAFVLTMVDDCTNEEGQQKFSKGMQAFDKFCESTAGQSFLKSTVAQRQSILVTLEQKQHVPDDVQLYYDTVKQYTIQSFTSSEQFMTDIRQYKMVPGPSFKGCVPV